jgi:2-polyprenyl-3-methyl-5-hydroxy-6-metoxy-1,4-benzoquinol methylase
MTKNNFDIKLARQDEQYSFPYHYIPGLNNGHFSQHLSWSWGFRYIGALEFVLDELSKFDFKSMIDVGCGDGRLLHEAAKMFESKQFLGVDYSSRAIGLAKSLNPHLRFRCRDIVAKPLPSKFDVVTLIEVLEHIPPDELPSFVAAACSLARKKGRVLITVPHVNSRRPLKHYQHFSQASISRVLSPHLDIVRTVFLDKKTRWFRRLMKLALNNKLVLLNHQPSLDFLYRLYKKKYFFTDEQNASRIFIEATIK